ncbi:hypothetical protein ACU5AY_08930 [Rhizobium sp. PAMB 3174]
MVWTSQPKKLGISITKGHRNTSKGVSGRVPAITDIQFTPLELFGAAARCGHLHFINPALATPESHLMAALIEQYVDEAGTDFAILATANNFKDFAKSHFAGTVAAGLAYLAMVQDGYQWVDHFEKVTGGNPAIKKSPDFVFTGQGTGTALLESKGTRGQGLNAFDSRVETGYLQQVEPHLGYTVNGVVATHGYAIGSWMTSTTKAEMIIHHTAGVTSGGSGSTRPSPQVQQHNYATATNLVIGPDLSNQIRMGLIKSVPSMVQFWWLGHSWLMRPQCLTPFLMAPDPLRDFLLLQSLRHPAERPWEAMIPFMGFAIEERTATAVFSHFSDPERFDEPALDIDPLSEHLREEARSEGEAEAGAVFPDGLAVVGWRNIMSDPRIVTWNRETRRFE